MLTSTDSTSLKKVISLIIRQKLSKITSHLSFSSANLNYLIHANSAETVFSQTSIVWGMFFTIIIRTGIMTADSACPV